MVDELTRYYLRKSNFQVSDEFHERLELKDIDELNSATLYMVAAPVVTGCVLWGYKIVTEQGGASSHFAWAVMRARTRFGSSKATSAKWPSKKPPAET